MKIYKTTEKQRAAARQWQIDNPDRYKARQATYRREGYKPPRAKWPAHWTSTDIGRFKRFKVTPEDVQATLAKQGGCAVCRVVEPRGKNHWHVDHDHNTGRVRGVLCLTCNIAVGMLHDDPVRARAAADYLEHHAQLQSLL